jgi:hypothetical protein
MAAIRKIVDHRGNETQAEYGRCCELAVCAGKFGNAPDKRVDGDQRPCHPLQFYVLEVVGIMQGDEHR